MKLRKKFNKVTAWILTCILFFTMAFSITSEAYGEGYTHAKQFKNCHIYNGIDVSTWNKQIDWSAVKASGIDFAFIKVGGRGWGSAGTLYHDSRALENLKGAKAAGIKIGVYFFSQAITEKEAAEEAQYTINYLHTYGISIDLPIAMDFEYASDSPTGGRLRTANLTREQATNVCLAFCSYVATRGYTPMVYANKSMLTNDMNASTIASRYPIWLAQYNSSATYTGAYSYWQYTSSGTVPGIEGRVDMNFYYSTDGSFSSKINIPVPNGETAPADAKIVYATHIQTYGWEKEETYDGGISGTVGQAKRLEAIKIRNNTGIEGSVEYQVHCQSFGWMDWTMDGDIAGLTGLAKRLEAIRIRLTGQLAEQYDVYYRVQCQTYGWLDWAKNGQTAGSTNYAKRLEAIQIKLVEKGGMAPGNTSKVYVSPLIGYNTHVQTYGWTGTVFDGTTGGTTGHAKRLESISITNLTETSGNVVYRVHGQTYGWQGWRQNGAQAGSIGQAKRLEAIQIKLTGALAEKYDVYYRVHCQTYGWMGWAKNGDPAGTTGHAKRLEAIQIVLRAKGTGAPGASSQPAYVGGAVPQ